MILFTGSWRFYINLIVTYIFLNCMLKLNCFKINVPSVLLAYNLGLPSNYTVEITGEKAGECFLWQSVNPQIIHVTPIFSSTNCSKKAVLSSVAYLLEKRVTQVFATVIGNHEKQIFIDVITDNVDHLEFSYLTDEMVLGSSPQILSLIGKDKHGHSFTSINGLEVQWKIEHDLNLSDKSPEDISGNEVIRMLKFDSSDYEFPENKCHWERRGLFSNSVLLRPMEVGIARITAFLLFSSKPVFQTQEMSLKVIPNWRIRPSSSLYLLPNASVNMRAEKFLNGKYEDMNMQNFEFRVEDSNIIGTSKDKSTFTANDIGHSIVSYRSVNKDFPDFTVKFHVVKLARIGLILSSGNFKTLEEMKMYEFMLDLYDENDNLIYPSDNLRFSINFPTKLFHVNRTTSNGTYALVQTISPGPGSLRVEYKGLHENGLSSKENKISASFDVSVCQRLNIFPPNTLLPVVSSGETYYEVILMVTGGTGDYSLSLSDNSVAKVIEDKKTKILLQVSASKEIDLVVTVTDKNNVNFVATSKISVQLPADIDVFPTVVEAEVDNIFIIPTAFLGYEDKEKDILRKFDNCSKIEPIVNVVDKYVLSYEKESRAPEFGRGCMNLQFRCKFPGHSRVNIEYTVKSNKNTTSRTTTTVLSCFKALKPVHPVRVAVLALGTSKEVAFEGGPRKWPLKKDGHFTKLEASNPDLVSIELIKDPVRYNKELTVFRVTCKSIGENTLTFRIGNLPSATIRHPTEAQTTIKFICAEPYSVHLKLFKKKNSKRQENENLVKVPFYGEKIFAVDIWVKDDTGRKFANISSLRVLWEVSDKTLAQPESYFDFMTHENAVAGYRKLSRNFKEFKMTGDVGELTVTAKLTNYRKEVLSKINVNDYSEIKHISKSIDLKLVSMRDIHLYEASKEKTKDEGFCDNDSCNS